MKTPRHLRPSSGASARELADLRLRLAEADQTLRAIRAGEVDTMLVSGKKGDQVFTLQGAEHDYRILIESMNEGALMLTTDKNILYANQCFARLVKCPLEQVTGSSFRRFLSAADQATLRPLMKQAFLSGTKLQMILIATDGSPVPVQLSIQELARDGSRDVTIGMVVTDMTEARRTEELLRALTHRVVQVQEAERGNLALELHDNVTQLLCAVVFSSQALAGSLAAHEGPAKEEALRLCAILGQTAAEVERISRDLRPGALDQMGLVDVLCSTGREFAARTGVAVKLACRPLSRRLPAAIELALYRILQESLKNIERHAHARHVTVALTEQNASIQLSVKDDGVGFDAEHHAIRRNDRGILGLIGMRERATAVGGLLTVKSGRRAGTEIEVSIPLPPDEVAA